MNTIVVTSTKQNIKFGYEGEDNVTKIIFPYDESWLEYGEGNFEVRILRCGDEVAYTATDVVDDRQAMTLTMTVTDIELSVRGRGEMQLCYVCPDSIKKSPIYQYTVNRSVDYKYAVDPPEGSIIASVEKSLSEIKNTTNRLSNSVISIESSIDDVNSQIDNINDKISEFDEEIDSIGEVKTRVDNLETSTQSINGRINTAEGNINENTESISDLNESVTELENRKVTDLETSGGKSDSGKYLTVGTDGKIKATSLTIPPTITVDASLSTTSTNPVQNKVIKTELNNINSNIETCNTEISKINGSLGDVKADLADVENEINTKTEVHPVPSISFSGNTSNSDPLVVTTGGYVYFRNFESAYKTMRAVSCGASYSISNGDVLFYDISTRTLSISGSNSDVIDDNHVALLWKHGTFIKGAWAVYYYEYVLNAAYPGVKEYAEQNRSLFDVTPYQAISFSGNETASDPLIVSTGGYYATRNYDSTVGTFYRTRPCDATYTINNGYGLFYRISTNALSIIQMTTMPSDDYILLLWKNSTTIKGLWAVYYDQKTTIARFNEIGASSKNYTRASKTVGSFYSAFANVQIVEGKTYEININTGDDTGTVILTTAANINSASIVQTLGIKKNYIFTANATQATALYVGCYIKAENTNPVVIDIYVNDLSNKYNAPVLHNYREIEQISRVQQPIPVYFNSYLDGKIADINDAMAQSYNMDAFIFVTDNHITKNSLTSFPVMREILAHTAVDKVIYNGDVVYAYGPNTDILKAANLNLKGFKGLTPYGKVFMNRGNHDFTIKNTGDETGYTYGTAFTYEYLTKMMEHYANVIPGKMYWYYDNPVQKIRYIGVDTTDSQTEGATAWGVNVSFSQEQVDWLCEKLNVKNEWSVVVTGHIPVLSGNETTRLGVLAAILKAYANKTVCSASYDGVTCSQDFSNYKGTLVCYMCGHTHIDGTTTSDGVLEIRTTCDAMITDDGSTRTYGTITEMAIDVVVIDKDNETISTIRVGSGSDRDFSY